MHPRSALQAGIASLGTALAWCVDVALGPSESESFSDNHDVSDETVVAVSNRNGDVTLRPV